MPLAKILMLLALGAILVYFSLGNPMNLLVVLGALALTVGLQLQAL